MKLRHSVSRLLLPVLMTAASILLTLFVLFILLEAFPEVLDALPLDQINYYAQKRKWHLDEELVYVPRKKHGHIEKCVLNGDMYDMYYEKYGLQKALDGYYIASYDANGFRTNSSQAPYDLVLIGDSFIQIGESDDKTLSEQLKASSGLRTCNLGRGGYGPYQYVKVLRRYALDYRPRFALFCFYSGNDIQDIKRYENWLRGGQYHNMGLTRRSFLGRFAAAMSDTGYALKSKVRLRSRIKALLGRPYVQPRFQLEILRLGAQKVPMLFGGSDFPTEMPKELIATPEWVSLRNLLIEFKDICCKHEITPVVVYIPHKMEVYAELIEDPSGEKVITRPPDQVVSTNNSITAFRIITSDLNLDLIDLTNAFRSAALKGALLYYPADSHWNLLGRQIAARLIGSRLQEIETYELRQHWQTRRRIRPYRPAPEN